MRYSIIRDISEESNYSKKDFNDSLSVQRLEKTYYEFLD